MMKPSNTSLDLAVLCLLTMLHPATAVSQPVWSGFDELVKLGTSIGFEVTTPRRSGRGMRETPQPLAAHAAARGLETRHPVSLKNAAAELNGHIPLRNGEVATCVGELTIGHQPKLLGNCRGRCSIGSSGPSHSRIDQPCCQQT